MRKKRAERRERMKNFEILKQMPQKEFANMVFRVTRNECNSLTDFEEFLDRNVPKELEDTVKGALQTLQCSSENN